MRLLISLLVVFTACTPSGTDSINREDLFSLDIGPMEDQIALYNSEGEGSLGRAGFAAYQVSTHARAPAALSPHTLIYWRGGHYEAVGPGAHGRLDVGGVRHAISAGR